MRADKVMLLCLLHEFHNPINLPDIARRAEVVAGINMPIGKESVGREIRILEGPADGHFRNGDDDLIQPLLHDLVEA